MRLTERAHRILGLYLQSGQQAVDATLGNGHDCCFLAQRVGPSGKVFGFDIQATALTHTTERLRSLGLEQQVTLFQQGHQHLASTLPATCQGHIQAVTFNLGYLPHGDKQITTRVDTTLQALEQSHSLLAPTGIISVLAYRGHKGGEEEHDAVQQQLQQMENARLKLSIIESPGPVLLILAPRRHD